MKKIGCFSGTFDPIHFGHIKLTEYFLANSDLDEIWLIITPLSPYKLKEKSSASNTERYIMAQKAMVQNKLVKISDVEFALEKPNYTIKTLNHLTVKYPENDFVLIIGEDNLSRFQKWLNYEEILNSYGLYVYPRNNSSALNNELKNHSNVKSFNAPLIDISSTGVKKDLANKKDVSKLIDPKVYDHILKNNLYKK